MCILVLKFKISPPHAANCGSNSSWKKYLFLVFNHALNKITINKEYLLKKKIKIS